MSSALTAHLEVNKSYSGPGDDIFHAAGSNVTRFPLIGRGKTGLRPGAASPDC